MQNSLKCLAILISVFLCFSCSSSSSENDSNSAPDADSDTQDSETIDEDSDLQDSETIDEDSDLQDSDFIEDSEETPDVDADQETDSDTPETVECLDLRYNENTIKTPFPFKDKNGKPTFCRPGCDTPTENDPQCVRNIWEWDNWEEYQVYLKAQEKDPNQEWERECYPWPCKLPDMHAKTQADLDTLVSKCDRLLTVHNFKANSGTVNTHGMSDGVAGMDFSHTGRIVEYDPERNEYTTVGQNKTMLAFNENRYVTIIHESDPPNNEKFKSFIISVFRKNDKYYYELIHDNENHNSFLTRPALAGKKWVLIHVKEGDQGLKTEIKYASSKDWEWHELSGINNYAGEGNIVGDHLTFITNNRELYYCDLRKLPKHIDECFKLNRTDESGNEESGHSPRIDLENEYRVVYNVYGKPTFVEADLHDLSNPKYTEHKVEKSRPEAGLFGPSMVRGNRVVYIESDPNDDLGCFYRFDKQKTYCQRTNNFSTDPADLMGYNVFWGKWHLWKEIGRTFAIMRDWECYCEETGICPLEQ